MCCASCFNHKWLRDYVRQGSTQRGVCDYCKGKDAELIAVAALYEPFQNLMGVYTVSDAGGDFLIDLVQDDYGVFSEGLYDNGRADRLFDDIMESGWDDDSGEPMVGARDRYGRASAQWFHTTMADRWQDFCAEVMLDPDHQADLPELLDEELARMEVVVPKGRAMYRARIGFVEKNGQTLPFEGVDIGAPPPDKVKPGRANASGESVGSTSRVVDVSACYRTSTDRRLCAPIPPIL
jgi:hypothetical protein